MRIVFTTLLLAILILFAVAVAIFLLSLGFVGMGWLLSRILPLSLFEASVIALLSGLGLAYVIGQIISIPIRPTYDEDWEDEEDWDEEDWDEEWEEDEYEEPLWDATTLAPAAVARSISTAMGGRSKKLFSRCPLSPLQPNSCRKRSRGLRELRLPKSGALPCPTERTQEQSTAFICKVLR